MPLKFADKSAYLKKTEDSKEKIANIKPRILNDERRTVIIVSDAEDGLNSEVSNDGETAEYETTQSIPSISEKEKEEVYITIDDDTDTSDIGAISPKQIDEIQYSDEDNEPSIVINQIDRGSSKKRVPSEDEHTDFEEFITDEPRLNIPKRKSAKENDHDYSPKRKGKQRDSSLNSTPEPSSSRPKRLQSTPKKENRKAPMENKTSLEANPFENISKRRFLKTGYVYDTVMSYHATPDPIEIHPEDPRRIYKIFAILEKHGLLAECQRIKSRRATREEITDIHSITHYRKMRETTSKL
ncbi:hypothetical protein G6F56_008994 [Rhizopus delemar]|nr:hypothetical protein G6F56_008994 [Rhizopus delemar]